VIIDVAGDQVAVRDADDCGRFHVESELGPADLDRALQAALAGHGGQDGEAWVSVGWVRSAASGGAAGGGAAGGGAAGGGAAGGGAAGGGAEGGRAEGGRAEGAAAGSVGADWPERFAAMLGYARGKGWLDEAGTHIRAHVVRGPGAGSA
jgi:hypothetical protein